ncbi:MAG: mechanosensitive ion channel [Pseudomonadota bacterium]
MAEQLGNGDKVSLLFDRASELLMVYAPKVVLAIVTLLVGLWLIKRLVSAMDRRLSARDPTLGKFLGSMAGVTLKLLLLISVASMVGIATTSFIAVLAAAGLAVGLALQGSLANFAGGVLILLFKPFKVGDVIEAQGFLGSVVETRILYTIMNTFDNRRVVIPNGNLSNSSLVNMSVYDTRRCDMTFGIGYSDDIDKAKAVCRRLIEEDERVLDEPQPLIVVGALGESSVDLSVRVWTSASDLWPFYWDMQERVKKTFDAEGISIPFPQRDLHMYKEE